MSFPLGMTSFPLYGDCLPPVRTTGELDALGLGGHGSMPAHLTRVLYIPAHGSDATHVQIHDFTAQYAAATRGLAVGGSRFRTRLFTMAKPAGNDVAGRVSYLVDIDPQGLHAVVRERSLGREEQQLCMSLVSEQEGTFHLHTQGAGSGSSYIAESSLCQEERRSLSLEERLFFSPEERRHPRLTLKQEPTSLDEPRHAMEWRAHPTEFECVRYDLVKPGTATDGTAFDGTAVQAVYYHCGLEPRFPQRYSEGLLFLPEAPCPDVDLVSVASLLGLLWQLRGRYTRPRKSHWLSFFRKSSVL